MKKLQAAMRDKAAKGLSEKRLYYRVGSVFKGCHFCGDYDEEEMPNGRPRKKYRTGLTVFRSYNPKWLGWTYKCWDCGSVDDACWENAQDIGMEPRLGVRSYIDTEGKMVNRRSERRKQAAGKDRAEIVVSEVKRQSKSQRLAEIEAQLQAMLEALLKK